MCHHTVKFIGISAMMRPAKADAVRTSQASGSRPGRRLVLFAIGVIIAAGLTFYERTTSPWVWLAKELVGAPHAFTLPLDTQSKGVQTGFETDPHGQAFLWGYGPSSLFRFNTYVAMSLRLCYAFSSPIEGQGVEVSLNGQHVAMYADKDQLHFPNDAGHPVCHEFVSKPGDNVIEFAYQRWNHQGSDFAANDTRKLAVNYFMMQILPLLKPAP